MCEAKLHESDHQNIRHRLAAVPVIAPNPPARRHKRQSDNYMRFWWTSCLTVLGTGIIVAWIPNLLSPDPPKGNIDGFVIPQLKKVSDTFRWVTSLHCCIISIIPFTPWSYLKTLGLFDTVSLVFYGISNNRLDLIIVYWFTDCIYCLKKKRVLLLLFLKMVKLWWIYGVDMQILKHGSHGKNPLLETHFRSITWQYPSAWVYWERGGSFILIYSILALQIVFE